MSKRLKSGFIVLFAMLLIFTTAQPAFAAKFPDVKTFKEEIEFLTDKKIINGYPDGTYRPENPILRVQAVLMIMRDLGIGTEKIPNPGFTDIKPGQPGYTEVAAAYHYGIISGKSATIFDPNGHLTRGEMAKILTNAYELVGLYPPGFTDVSDRSWSYPYISALAANGITNGYPDGSYRPQLTINRGQFAAFMARILEPEFKPFSPALADTLVEAAFDFQVVDVVKDPKKPVLYLIDGYTNSLVTINYETYEHNIVELPYPAERLAYANERVYVTQHKTAHNRYSDSKNEQGAYAVYNAATLKLIKLWHINMDPYDIEADDLGRVYISSGSSQWTYVRSFDSATGAILSEQGIYMSGILKLSVDQKKLFTITTESSPRNVSAYPIVDGKLQPEVRWSYHGDYPMTKDLWLTPDGKYFLNGYGNMFSANTMGHVGKLDRQFTSLATDTTYGELYTADGKNLITAYDYPSLLASYQMMTYGDVQHLFYDAATDQIIALSKVKFGKSTYSYMGVEKIYFEVE